MICIKYDQKINNLKNLNFGLLIEIFLGFFKTQNLAFFEAIFQPLCTPICIVQ